MRRAFLRLPLALAAALLLGSCGDPLLYLEVAIPELSVTLPGQVIPAFDGTPTPDIACGPSCLFKDVEYDFGDAIPGLGEDHVEVDLRLTGMEMVLDAGASDLSGVESVVFKLYDPDAPDDPAAARVVASYFRDDDAAAPTSIAVSGYANVDLDRYLTGSTFKARAELTYDAATPEFTTTITATFSALVKLDYGAYVGL